MKRRLVPTANIKNNVISLSELDKAVRKCKKGVRWKTSVINYTHNTLLRIYKLKQELENDTYKPIKGETFTIYEPKKRTVTSTKFRDRIPQRSLVDNYLYDELIKHYIPENCACLKNRGTDYARNILKRNLRNYYNEFDNDGYVLKIDIKSFFGSIDHNIAKKVMRKLIPDDWAFKILCDEIDLNGNHVGIGLGSQLNQYIALSMLNSIDHLCINLGFNHYVRYMDDIIIIHHSKTALKQLLISIKERLAILKLRTNDKKTMIFKLSQPIHFLGFSFKLHDTGRITMKLLKSKISRRRRKIKRQALLVNKGILSSEDYFNIYKSGLDHFKKGTRSQYFKIQKYFKRITEEILNE